ncbi:MAG: hypothetical protein RMJ98_13180 [Myxococcales bacterium]|nr:hypothetical protein [Polyangiaceae bacterium]MDW8250241.1 hypothetical protein [Myxococcales bacterium]
MILLAPPPGRSAQALAAALASAATLWTPKVEAVKVLVKGSTAIDGQVQMDGAVQVVRGRLRDDLGDPIPGARLNVLLLQDDGQVLKGLPTPRSCSSGAQLPQGSDGAYGVETNTQGMFCLRTGELPRQGLLRLRFVGQPGLTGTSVDLPFHVERPHALLSWDPKPEEIDLDAPLAHFAVSLGNGSGGVLLELLDERGKVLAIASTDERGRALFEVATTQLAGPGMGELTARTRHPETSGIKARVVRSARVVLVASPPREAIVPNDGHRFEIGVETLRGAAEGGVVEVRLGSEILGAGTVHGGRTSLAVAFDVPSEGAVDLTFRYLPASPGLRAGEPLVLRVPVKPPSPLRKAPLLLAGLLLVSWLARGWKRPPRTERSTSPLRTTHPTVTLPEWTTEPEVGATSWQGLVLDAHEHRPLPGVQIRVLSRDFYGEREVQQTTTNERGRFHLDGAWAPTLTLQVTAPWHVPVERPLPKPGRIFLGLVSRRRALLERVALVARRLLPEHPQEPTPEQLARYYEHHARPGEACWARAVEAIVFGRDPVGAREEAQLSAMEADLSRRAPGDGVRR